MRAGYDGRLSPVDSTRAAVRYLKTLHGMFAGDWRLAVMAYNAGEYRVFGALRRSGQVARDADPEKLESLSAPQSHACPGCGAQEGMKRQLSVAAFALAGAGWYKGAASEPAAPAAKTEATKPAHGCAAGGCGCPLAG